MAGAVRRYRGTVLLGVLILLFALSLLGTSLLLLATSDRVVSVNYMDQVRAGRLARSGVSAAVAALSADPFSPDLLYWGNDEKEEGRRVRLRDAEGARRGLDAPLETALNPSLAVELDGDPGRGSSETRKYTAVDAEGRTITFGVSGFHSSSTYGRDSDVYQLRIKEASSCLHLNDGALLCGGNQSSVSQNLRRMLNVLGGLRTVDVRDLGDRILSIRPRGGFASMTDLEKHFTLDEMNRIRPFVVTHSWVDKNVANPVPLSAGTAGAYPVRYWRGGGSGLYRRGRYEYRTGQEGVKDLQWFDPLSTDPGTGAIYALDELNPSYIEIVHRAPVNVNTARREVLITLLAGLQGFFVSERRAFAPYAPSMKKTVQGGVEIPKYYTWWTVSHSYDGQNEDGDEYGYLYRTQPISVGGHGRTTDLTLSAEILAEHIMACRERRMFDGVSYGDHWFGGPFRTWNQFNRFVDHLVEAGILQDQRAIFYDHPPGDLDTDWGMRIRRESKAARKFASYAIGDVLKANFNPNLHLNELNPDAHLYLRVDKTDLIVNSTEFTFMPTGVYEIESLGRVLRPAVKERSSTASALSASLHSIEASRRICASVRVFEPYRETTQRHFSVGTLSDKESDRQLTSSGKALEFGPEPRTDDVYGDRFQNYSADVRFHEDGYRGVPAGGARRQSGWGFEFDGYLTLATLGGRDPSGPKDSCRPHWPVEEAWDQEGMHVHFASGIDADYSRDGVSREERAHLGQADPPGLRNLPDRPGDPQGPLDSRSKSGAHRLARSFRLPQDGSTLTLPLLAPFAPGDLRTDGLYSERGSGAAYAMHQAPDDAAPTSTPGNFTFHGGVLSLWVKPSFFPEHTGKTRNIVSISKHHERHPYRSPAPFNVMFLPAHDRPAYEEPMADDVPSWQFGPLSRTCTYREFGGMSFAPLAWIPTEQRERAYGVWQFRPASFMALRSATLADAGLLVLPDPSASGPPIPDVIDLENYAVTSSLNHNLHPHGLDSAGTPNRNVTEEPCVRAREAAAGAQESPFRNRDKDLEEMRPNYFEAHRWTHVLFSWQVLPPT